MRDLDFLGIGSGFRFFSRVRIRHQAHGQRYISWTTRWVIFLQIITGTGRTVSPQLYYKNYLKMLHTLALSSDIFAWVCSSTASKVKRVISPPPQWTIVLLTFPKFLYFCFSVLISVLVREGPKRLQGSPGERGGGSIFLPRGTRRTPPSNFFKVLRDRKKMSGRISHAFTVY